jgi:hypothetical protein
LKDPEFKKKKKQKISTAKIKLKKKKDGADEKNAKYP